MSAEILKKMRKASIPPFTFKTTLEKEGHMALRAVIAGKEYHNPDIGYTSYVIHANDDAHSMVAADAVALMAKELVLLNVPVYYVTIAGIAREIRLYDYSVDDEDRLNPIFSRKGNSIIVVPDFGALDAFPSATNQRESMDWLAQHAQTGGGLILATGKYTGCTTPVHGHALVSVSRQFVELRINA